MIVAAAEAIQEYDKICDKVKNLDVKIRFAGIINGRGILVAGGLKQGVEPLEHKKEDEMLFMELALRVKMRKEFDKQLGRVNFAMASRKRSLMMSVPIHEEDVLYLVAEPDVNYKKIAKKTLALINYNT